MGLDEKYEDNYYDLANAIIIQAANDYMRVLRRGSGMMIFDCTGRYFVDREELERFFYGSWFGVLTTADPDILVNAFKRHAFSGKKLRRAQTHKK